MVGRRFVIVLAAAAACAVASPTVHAGTKCKSAAVSIGAISEGQAMAVWRQRVRKRFGPAWSNFNLARNKSVTDTPLPVTNLYFVSGYPCRRT